VKTSSGRREIRSAKTRVMSKGSWKVISLVAGCVTICALFIVLTPVLPLFWQKLGHWVEDLTTTTTEESLARRRAYVEQLERPKLSGKEVSGLLKEQKLIKTKDLYDMADWYVYHGNRDVIKQVLINRQFEMKITLPEESGGVFINTDYTVAGDFNGPYWHTDEEILIHHQVMHEYAAMGNADPHFIFYLLENAGWFSSEEYQVLYAQLLFYDEIRAFLRIYARYKEWPTIRKLCEREIGDYPCVWRDWQTIDETLAMADAEGAEQAYRFYLDRYRRNYQEFRGVVYDIERPEKAYDFDGATEGWSSKNISVKMNVHDVDSQDAMGCIRDIRKVFLVLRDGKDITKLCEVRPGNYLRVPLTAGKLIELEFKVHVTPHWWDRYMQKRVDIDIPGA